MPRYAIIFHAIGLSIPVEGEKKKIVGFYTPRFINGADERDAHRKARDRLLNEKKIIELIAIAERISAPDEIPLEMDSIARVKFFSGRFRPNAGLVFYQEEPIDPPI